MPLKSKKKQPIVRFDKIGIVKVGLILKEAREQQRLTLEDLSYHTGIGRTRLNDVELGNVNKLMPDTLEAYRLVVRPINPETGKVYQPWELLEMAMIIEAPQEEEE